MALGPMSRSEAITRRTDVPPPTFYDLRYQKSVFIDETKENPEISQAWIK